jgi:ribosome-associated protein
MKKGQTKAKFHIEGESIELAKLLKASGLCSTGGMAKIVTAEGRVKVDHDTELRKGRKIRKGQVVEFGGHTIEVM